MRTCIATTSIATLLALLLVGASGCGDRGRTPCLVEVGGVQTDLCSGEAPEVVCAVANETTTGCLRVTCPERDDATFCAADLDAATDALAGTTCSASLTAAGCLAIACGEDGAQAMGGPSGLRPEACERECSVLGIDAIGCVELTCADGWTGVVCRADGAAIGVEALAGSSCTTDDSGAGCTQVHCRDGSAGSVCEGVSCTVADLEAGGCARLTCDGGARTSVCADSDPVAVGRSLGAKACSAAFPVAGCPQVRCADDSEAFLCSGAACEVASDAACARVSCEGVETMSLCPDDAGVVTDGALDETGCALRLDGSGCGDVRCADGSTGSVCGDRRCSVSRLATGCASLQCGRGPALTLCAPDAVRARIAATDCTFAMTGSCGDITCGDGSTAQICPYALPDLDFDTLLAQSVRFFGAQRSGDASNWLLGGAACHLDDGESVDRDLAGGWYDAGDHLKFSLTIAYATYVLFKSYEAFPSAFGDAYDRSYGPPNGIPDVLDEAVVGADYLTKLLRSGDDALVTRVGDASDHTLWVTCLRQETLPQSRGGRPRPVTLAVNPDVAALSAAALAAGARVFERFDPARATTWLAAARSQYALARAHADDAPYSDAFYTNSSALDDRLCGAAELWATTGESAYRDDSLALDTALGPHHWVTSWSQVADLCRHTLAKRGQTTQGYDTAGQLRPLWNIDVNRYLTTRDADGVARLDDWGLLRYALGAAFSAALLFDVDGDERYRSFALEQIAYAAGKNARGYSFVVGFGPQSPRFPHHRNAYGDDSNPSDDTKNSVPPRHLLLGALVGGTSPPGAFPDRLTDFKTSEVSIDFNAVLVGVTAFAASLR